VLAANGARVVLAARRLDALEQLRDEIEAEGGRAIAVDMDVTAEASVAAAFDAAATAFGPVDSVIANAGTNVRGPALELDAAAFDQVMAVNARGVFLTVCEGARRMIAAGAPERKHGRIVIISSVNATTVAAGMSVYSASKAAVLQMGRVLARDWANRGINVNILCPGYIETELNADWFETERGKRQIVEWPRRRLMTADVLDPMLLYLLSDACSQVTGSVFSLDDGQML
jgi:NAD(P)-dependent dehydrogenase (short-subunit alcohol dehydrogenase family)